MIAAILAAAVFSSAQGLGQGCVDLGWAPRRIERGTPARIDLSGGGGWLIGCDRLRGPFAALRFRVRGEPAASGFLEVQFDAGGPAMPRVPISRGLLERQPDGWERATMPISLLAPAGAAFQRIVFRARAGAPGGIVFIDDIEVVEGAPLATPTPRVQDARLPAPVKIATATASPAPAHASAPRPAPPATPQRRPIAAAPIQEPRPAVPERSQKFGIRCDQPDHPISPLVYSLGFLPYDEKKVAYEWSLRPPARRWGGNLATRYNWELGNAWNTGNDWFFTNVNYTGLPGPAWKRFLEENAAHGAASAFTLPTIGWVAKDIGSYSFSVGELGPQRAVAPENHDAGNGVGPDGTPLRAPPPERTSVPAPPGFIARWASAIREANPSGPRIYFLDNEPSLWSSTHRDVHPEPLGYDELLERSIAYASAVRTADPQAIIAGPAEWGWLNFFYSAKDMQSRLRTDRLAHGGMPLLPWWLREMRKAGKRMNMKLIDVLDVHAYSEAGIGVALGGATDAATAARRIRATRMLWDPTYQDESWIAEPVMLIPRLRNWIAENDPGLGISFGEWNFGAEGHMSGGLAAAEALGRFGVEGVRAAWYWAVPPDRTPAYWAFRAYRDYDGRGARFLDASVPTRGSDGSASLFASRGEGSVVTVLLNFDPALGIDAQMDASTCGKLVSARTFVYAGGEAGFAPGPKPQIEGGVVRVSAPPYSIEVLELRTDEK